MPRPCSICTHAAHRTIEQALEGGVSYRAIAHTHGLSTASLVRHRQHGVAPAVTDTVSVTEQAPAPCTCPCTRIDWRSLAQGAQQLCEGMQDRHSPHVAVEALKIALALLAKLTASACAPPRAP